MSYSEPPPTPAGLEEVKYEVLMEATAGFDRTPYKEGGHKVGEGGFGEVFQCSLVLQGGPVHAAVKVLLNKVRRWLHMYVNYTFHECVLHGSKLQPLKCAVKKEWQPLKFLSHASGQLQRFDCF